MISSSEFSEPKSRQERQERRARLERESEIVKAQIQELKSRLPHMYKAGPSKAPSKQGNVSKKRPAPAPGEIGGDSKRQRVEFERARRINSIWQQCHTILKGLSKSKDAHPFLKPVDVKYSKCPDYFEIIKHPMDLGTIQKKFPGKGKQILRPSDPSVYSTPYEFRDDMRLVWSNCRTYNPPHVPVRNMGEAMSDAWEKKWTVSGIEAKWDEEMHRQTLEEQELTGGDDIAQQIQVSHDALVKKVAVSESNPGYSAPQDGLAMSFEQKRRLSIAIGQLPGDRISEVMRIISEDENMRLRADSDEEVEVDIDQLSTDILWKLDRYTRGVVQKVRKKPGSNAKGPDAQGSKAAAVAQPPPAEAAPLNGGTAKADHHHSSSSSSGDSGTDRSDSDSEGEVGSKDLGGGPPTGNAAPAGQKRSGDVGNDAVTLISATTPAAQPQIVKSMASKKEVNLQNENAWADLGKDKGDDGNGDDGDDEDKDVLWDEFKSREQEEEQREKEKKAEEERQKQERLKKEEAARAEAEERAKAAEAAAQAQKNDEAAKIKAQRDKEMQEIENVKGENFEAGAQELMDSKRQGDTLNVLGLQRKDSSDEDSDNNSSS